MARSKAIEHGIKYTVVLPEQDIELLKDMVDNKVALSVNAAVREAVEEYIVKTKKEIYKKGLIDAVNNSDFIKRTEESMEYYRNTDKEAEEMGGK
ncbi:MAG: hypothetical protein FIA99_19880 [Ruminiclostridium sp.]|nr:hypothetical protein [Ruminiclostridium sp.]